ncbi:hypothetical protein [Vibrio japonicus]|uniref:Uncharacterized protein n=1 Tax=Vibrio japonicus TaxID=1824638 RepID=A0ABY5LM84_9VIBR|nr:hypothetical protein [Vibrio japonicus]UUM31893.1 hypothetical protein NP165_16455 [Vibrio japonicus]
MSSPVKLLAIALALTVGFFAGDLYETFQNRSKSTSLSDYCLLSTKACLQDDIKVTVDRDISQPLIPTQVTVEWPQSEANELFLKLEGHEMEMGVVIFKLQKNAQGSFSGEVILPVCTTDSMTWVGELSDGQQLMKTSLRMER